MGELTMIVKPNSKKTRLIVLAAVPVVASLFAPGSANAATQTWSGMNSNFIGTVNNTPSKSNWASPDTAAGSNATTTNTDLAVLPTSLSGANFSNPEPIYIATTSNANTAYYLGAFDMVDAVSPDVGSYEITDNNNLAGAPTADLYLNGTTVSGVPGSNTILVNNTISTNTTLEIGSDLGSKAGSAPLAVILGNTTNNISVGNNDQIVILSSVGQANAGSSLTVAGGGAITLSGANSYSGGTTITGSTLVAGYAGGASTAQSSTGTSASNVTLNGSTLASAPLVTSFIAGSVSVGTSNNTIAPGGIGAAGTLAIAGTLTLNGSSTLDFDLNGSSGGQLILGTLAVSGTPTIDISSNGPSGSYVLATYSTNNSLTNNSFDFLNVPANYTPVVTSTEIELMASGNPANVTWNVTPVSGSVSGTWDTTTGNWTGGIPVNSKFKSGDTANFNDIAGGTSGLISVVAGGVTPVATIIDNTNTTYSFTDADGTNGIGGGGSLTMNGSGTATLESPNSYSGGTIINGGTLIANGDATLGAATGGITLATGGTLQAGAAITSARNITVNAGGATFNTNGFNSVTSGSVTINDTFNVNSSGSLEIDGAVSFNTVTLTGSLNIGTGTTVIFGDQNTSLIISQINSGTYNGKLVVTGQPRLNFDNNATISGTGEIDITNPGTLQNVTIPATTSNPAVTYTTYDTGVAITNTKQTTGVFTAGGTIDVPIKLNANNLSFTPADVTQPDASFVPGNFTVSIGGTTAGLIDTINGVISGNSDVNIANAPGGGGAGELVLGAQNQYTGTTLMNASGTLQLAVSDALPIGTDVIFGTINGAEGAGTTIDLDGNIQQWDSLSSGQWGEKGSAVETITNLSFNPATLVISGTRSPANKFKGTISDGLGGVSLVKGGTNTVGLSGTNAYSGGTTLSGGTLNSANDDNLGLPAGLLTFNGGTLGVTGSLLSPYISSRPITVNPAGGTIDVAGTTSYTLTASPAISWGGTLNFTDTGLAAISQTGGTISVAPGATLGVAAGANLTVSGSTDPFTDNTGSESTPLHVAVVNNGSLAVNGGLSSTIASITGTGSLTVGDGISTNTLALANNGIPSSVGSLSILGNSTLDIGNNKLFIDYGTGLDPIASIQQWIKNGFYDLAGPQIISSDIAADDAASGLSYGIGYADGADGIVAGLPSGEIEIMFTLLGDANLDGTVNTEDFTQFSTNLGQSGKMWDDGDFNYDGTVNTEDFTLFSHNLGESDSLASQGSPLVAANGISLANVPEPASMGLLTLAGVGILARRRRRES
jgi:fibronectin-binding autotransporter adhesin